MLKLSGSSCWVLAFTVAAGCGSSPDDATDTTVDDADSTSAISDSMVGDVDPSFDSDSPDSQDTAVAPPTGVTLEVGPQGGELSYAGARLVIPPGALDHTVALGLFRTEEAPPEGYTAYSEVWRFEPDGLVFALPIRAELPFVGDAERATIFWSRPDGDGYAWTPTSVDGSLAIAAVSHFSDGFAADGVSYVDPVDRSCVATRILEGRRVQPSGVAVFFTVDDCNGNPITDLTETDFSVAEDGEALSVEAEAVVLPKPGAQAFVTLALDLSKSTDAVRGQLLASAQAFCDALYARLPGRVQVGIEVFAGMAESVRVQPPTLLQETIRAKLAELETWEIEAPNGTNLNGAVIDALARLRSSQNGFAERSAHGALSTGYLVLFTDGRDTTKLYTGVPGEVADALDESSAHVLAVGLEGDDYDHDALALLAPNGLFEASDSEGLARAFGAIANRIAGQFERTYLLGYCSPTLAGEHEVSVSVAQATTQISDSWTFSSEGFGPGCSGAMFEAACDARECGGLACGGCDDRSERCDGAAGVCQSLCETQQRCGGETFTNANGYEQTCDDVPVSTAGCGGEGCINLTDDDDNCGECGRTCPHGGHCQDSACLCPEGESACDGTCLDLSVDDTNCGECGHVCAVDVDGEVCRAGECVCEVETAIPCGASCRDIATDEEHCGGCGRRCAGVCVGGECVYPVAMDGVFAHTCAAMSDGRVACWGQGAWGPLGPSFGSSAVPLAVPGVTTATSVASGRDHGCALLSDQTVRCWGHDGSGQLGDGPTLTDQPVTVTDLTGVTSIAAGDYHTCALTEDHEVWCWGSNLRGQLGDGTFSSRDAPKLVNGLGDVGILTAASYHTCAAELNGPRVWCWGGSGDDLHEVVLDGPDANPIVVLEQSDVVQLGVGWKHMCVRTSALEVLCLGDNRSQQIGLPSSVDKQETPNAIDVQASDLSVGIHSTCVVSSGAQRVLCWGSNSHGQLGNSLVTMTDTPFTIWNAFPDPVARVFVTSATACAVDSEQRTQCWGANTYGQVGDGSTTDRFAPVDLDWSNL